MPSYLIVVRPLAQIPPHPLYTVAQDFGLSPTALQSERRYLVTGDLDFASAQQLATLVTDPLLATATIDPLSSTSHSATAGATGGWAIDIAYRPGVTDNEGESVVIGALRAGIAGLAQARTVQRVIIQGQAEQAAVMRFAHTVLSNDLVETTLVVDPGDTVAALAFYQALIAPPAATPPHIATVALHTADAEELARISREGVLALDPAEMLAIQHYFRDLGREPTDGELETLAQTWSEHCSHKTFKALIEYRESGPLDHPLGAQTINGLLKTFLIRATEAVQPAWLLSAFVDNAGIVALGDDDAISFKVETHNHPSALEPFGGANTGVGGVVRDVLGVSAQPIANLDVLCFGPSTLPAESLPAGVLHPARIAAGVVAGVRDYGNKLGVPTVAGAVLYDHGYTRNPLVFCGTLGLAARTAHRMGAAPGDAVVVVGGRTGRDGIHGATFSSEELTHDTAQVVGSAVQIGDPITEKRVIDVLLQASQQQLFRAITDCGAGGLSSAVGEMGEKTGVEVDLRDVPLKYPGLQPWEVWLSEAQERMVVAVPPATLQPFLALCASEDVEATVIGSFTDDQRLVVKTGPQRLVDLDMQFLHDGRPQRQLAAHWIATATSDPAPLPAQPIEATLLALLAHPNIASKEPIVRTYDHLVQGRTVQGPLGGVQGDGPTNGAVLHVRPQRPEAVAIGVGINPRYGMLDPYWMALAACDEAVRNVVAVGGDPERIALLDNFCWGDPRHADRLAGLVRATAGCHDAAVAWRMPFISGKDSLNNEYRDEHGQRVPIPPTLLISALGVLADVRYTTTCDAKTPGNLLYLVGPTDLALGGSHWLALHDQLGGSVPKVDLGRARRTFQAVHKAITQGFVAACHDLSEGGLGVAAAEMVIGGEVGIELDLAAVSWQGATPSDAVLLWSETPSRFLIEVAPAHTAAFEQTLAGIQVANIGKIVPQPMLQINGLSGETVCTASLSALKAAWQSTNT